MKSAKPDRRANWLALFEEMLIASRPEMKGKVDWDTAIYLYNQNLTVLDAVAQYLVNHPVEGQG